MRYNIFRWYRSSWGRYTQADPIGLRGDLNLYAYAKENPLVYIDANGLKCSKACPDCPGGKWVTYGVDTDYTVKIKGIGWGSGFSVFNAKCLSSSKKCTFSALCSKLLGVGFYLGVNFAVGGAFNAKCASDIEGISWGLDFDVFKEIGGSVGFDVSPNGGFSVKGGAGLGVGVAGTLNLCETAIVSCN